MLSPKWFSPVKLQDSLYINISTRYEQILQGITKIITQGNETNILNRAWLDMPSNTQNFSIGTFSSYKQ